MGSSSGDPATGSKSTQGCNGVGNAGERSMCLLLQLLEGSGGADAPSDNEFCGLLKWKQGSTKISPAFCYSC